jgi:hypothetical protein
VVYLSIGEIMLEKGPEETIAVIFKNVEEYNPTTTSTLDMLISPAYDASKGSNHHQEAEHVSVMSDRRRDVLHPQV